MKIRIKGASVRMRLSRPEVTRLVHEGQVSEETPFGEMVLKYAVTKSTELQNLSAHFTNNTITLFVPETLIENWDVNQTVGFEANMPLSNNKSLYLLLEKDFQCIDDTKEDQSDNYINPKQNC